MSAARSASSSDQSAAYSLWSGHDG
jgi:hypothetical protein